MRLINGVNEASDKASKAKVVEAPQLTQEELLKQLDKEKIMEELNLTWSEENGCFVDSEGNIVSLDSVVE